MQVLLPAAEQIGFSVTGTDARQQRAIPFHLVARLKLQNLWRRPPRGAFILRVESLESPHRRPTHRHEDREPRQGRHRQAKVAI